MDRHSITWRGYIPAMTTPFTEKGELDLAALDVLLQWLLDEGMHGVIVGGTVGEWFSIAHAERIALLAKVSSKLKGKIPLISGCNAFSADDVAENARLAADAGFDGILVTPPPYMVPSEREILRFYQDVDASV